jgi:site-specific DNA-methyltransferase (adenine-specific)
METWKNQLYFGDNLDILRGQRIPAGSVDLIYLDPPFNSNATYNVLFAEKSGEKSAAQITAFEDTWQWGDEAMAAYDDAMKLGVHRLADLLQALRAFLGQNDMMATTRDGRPPGGIAPGPKPTGSFICIATPQPVII